MGERHRARRRLRSMMNSSIVGAVERPGAHPKVEPVVSAGCGKISAGAAGFETPPATAAGTVLSGKPAARAMIPLVGKEVAPAAQAGRRKKRGSGREPASMPRLQDKIALITGAASGIGAATAALFAAEGTAGLVLTDLRPEALAAVAVPLGGLA